MNILLTAINAKYIHSNLAVHSLKAGAGEISCHIEIAEFTINHYVEDILRELYKKKPDVLLFSCYIWNLEYVKELTAECHKLMPEVPIWVGGPEVSYDAEQMLENYPQLAGILCGEGEASFRGLAEYYVNQNTKLSDIRGIVYRDVNGQIQTNAQNEILDMDTIPFAYSDMGDFSNKIIYYETSRGCPFSCSYCLSSIDKRVRFRGEELVKKELQFFLDQKVPQVKFVDRTFNCKHSHSIEIWRYLLEHDNGVTNFHFEIAADLLNEEEMELMSHMRPGLIQLEIGVQSTNPDTIREIDRTMDFETVKRNVNCIHSFRNIHQHLDLIAGLPFENYESFGKSFQDVFALKPEQLQLGFLKVLKGSKMYQKAEEYGVVYRDKPPYEVLYTKWISYADILKLKGIEQMVEVYYNSHQFDHTLEELIKTFETPFAFFEKLAQYYEENGLNQINHSRLKRYEILLDFIEKSGENPECYTELMTLDLYLRENVKSRPAWAKDLTPYKAELRELQKQAGKQAHIEPFSWGYGIFDYEHRDPLTGDAKYDKADR